MKFNRKLFARSFAVALSALALSAVSVQASLYTADYDFTGQPGDQASTAATLTGSGLSASDISRGSGLTASAAGGSISSSAWTTTSSLDVTDYYEFTLTPASGFQLDVDSIAFAERRSGTGIRTFTIRSSLDSFATDIITPVGVPDDTATRNQSFTLGSAFDDLIAAVTFRIYGYGAEASGGTWRLTNNSNVGAMQISGEIDRLVTGVVPEPASLLVWAGAGLLGACVVAYKKYA